MTKPKRQIEEVLVLMDVMIANSLHAESLRHRSGSSVVQGKVQVLSREGAAKWEGGYTKDEL